MDNFAKENRMVQSKFLEGINRFGLLTTAFGIINTLILRVFKRSENKVITKKDGLIINFQYPEQYMPTLVLYKEITVSEIEYLRKTLRPGDIYLDVGTGIGCYAVFAAKIRSAKVYAFEPMPLNIKTIRQNISDNGIDDKIELAEVAVSNKEGVVSLIKPEEFGTYFNVRVEDENVPGKIGDVATLTLDNFCETKNLKRIRMLNLDVEGHDSKVLEGAQKILSQGLIDIIMMEVHYSYEDIYTKLLNYGYEAFYYDVVRDEMIPLLSVDRESLKRNRPSAFNRRVIFTRNT
jgi:FkbM family methyltransferase